MATRVLDGGALGIVIPHVDTAEEAREIVDKLRYPPRGHRSVAGGLPHLAYAKHSLRETCDAIDAATFVIVMLETPTAIANADKIAAVSGIDSWSSIGGWGERCRVGLAAKRRNPPSRGTVADYASLIRPTYSASPPYDGVWLRSIYPTRCTLAILRNATLANMYHGVVHSYNEGGHDRELS
jgi:hypothetical protein